MMEWIHVNDDLPKDEGLYFCCGRTIDWNMDIIPDIIFTAFFYLPDNRFSYPRWCERTRSYEDVTVEYWIKIPELPKEIINDEMDQR
jgi:hypothetical protein